MWNALTKRMERFDKVVGLELNYDGHQTRYHMAMLERKKDVVTVTAHKTNCTDLKELTALLDPKIPLVLSIDGKGVLHKLISGATTNRAQQLSQVLPNAAVSEFHLQITPSNQGPIASVIRQDQLEEVFNTLREHPAPIVQVWLGAFHVRFLGNIAEFSTYSTQSYNLEFAGNQIINWNPIAEHPLEDYRLGDQFLPGKTAVSVASGLLPLIQQGLPETPQPECVIQSKNEFLGRQLIKKLGMRILLGLLALLLINFIVFQHYFTANSELEGQLFVQRTQLSELDTLKSQFKRQQQLFSQYNLNQSSSVSYYADRLAATLPKTITLEQLTIHPAKSSKQGRNKHFLFEGNQITVSGMAKDCLAVNGWSGKLKTLDWVQDARIVRCGVGDDGKLGFLIKIIKE